jgi:antitoxin VapB
MAKTSIAKLFQNGSSQAVRLPREFRFKGDRVHIRRVSGGVLIEPIIADVDEWFQAIDDSGSQPFLKEERNQPVTPRRRIF